MAGEADALSRLTDLQATTVSEEEMSEANQKDAVVPDLGRFTQTETIAIEDDSQASSADRRLATRLSEPNQMDAMVPERGGPSTPTGTMAREGDDSAADSRRLSEEEWRQMATTNIDASEIDCGKRCIQSLWEGISLISSAYSRVMRPPEEEPLLSEMDRAAIAAARIDFFERMAQTEKTVLEDAPGLSADFMNFGLAEEERVTPQLVRLAEERQVEEERLESPDKNAKMGLTLTDPHNFASPVEDRNKRARTETKAEKEDMLARGSTLLQTAKTEPALLDFEVNVPPIGFIRSDMTVMWSRCNFSTPIEPGNSASAETGEPSSPPSPSEPADEEVTLVRLINSPVRPGGLANPSHMELAQDLEVALATLTNSPQRQGGVANATHMELSQELVQALEEMTISSSNTGVGEQQEEVREQVNERSSPRANFDRAHFMVRRRSRSRERYRPYSTGYSTRARRSLYTRSLQYQSPSPDRTRRARSYSRDPPGDPSTSRSRDPTQIASSSSRQESPCRRALEADGFFSPRSNVRRHRRRRANAEFLDYCSQTEKTVESD